MYFNAFFVIKKYKNIGILEEYRGRAMVLSRRRSRVRVSSLPPNSKRLVTHQRRDRPFSFFMPHYLYIIQPAWDDSYYVGTTQDVDKRLVRHNQGRSKYTKAKCPWQLVYFEEHPDRSSAMKREYENKRKKKRSYIEKLIRMSKL